MRTRETVALFSLQVSDTAFAFAAPKHPGDPKASLPEVTVVEPGDDEHQPPQPSPTPIWSTQPIDKI